MGGREIRNGQRCSVRFHDLRTAVAKSLAPVTGNQRLMFSLAPFSTGDAWISYSKVIQRSSVEIN